MVCSLNAVVALCSAPQFVVADLGEQLVDVTQVAALLGVMREGVGDGRAVGVVLRSASIEQRRYLISLIVTLLVHVVVRKFLFDP